MADPTGAAIPGVKVTAKHIETGIETSTVATTGVYTIPYLASGSYELTAEQTGFRKHVQSGITVAVGTTVTVDIRLDLGATEQVVEVKGEAPLLNASTSDLSTVIDNRTYTNLPLNVSGNRRDPVAFIFLSPGVTGDSFSAQVNGGVSFSNELWIDGAPAGLAGLTGSARPAQFGTSVDAVNEFKLSTNNYSADLGRAAGVLSLDHKSGTNNLHGTAYEFLRNDAFDARGFFPRVRPRSRQHEFGGNVGGPILIPKVYDGRNRTFFFADINYYKNRPGASGFRVTIPTIGMKAGDFRGVAPIYDPLSTRRMPDGTVTRDRIACNGQLDVICPDRISRVSKNFLPLLPDPESPMLVNNYEGRLPGSPKTDNRSVTLRFDHHISSKQNLTYVWTGGPAISSPSAGNVNGLLGPLTAARDFGAFETVTRLSHTYTIKPNVVNYVTLGFNRDATEFFDPQFGVDWPSKLGLTGIADPRTMPSVNFETDGLVPWHPATFVGSFLENNNSWTVQEQLSWFHGKHSFKFGLDIRRLDVALFVSSTPGNFNFSALATGLPGTPRTGNAFASFLLGAPSSAGQSIQGAGTTSDRWKYYAWFFQDDWKVAPKLTLNLGIRYDLPLGRYELRDRLSSLDPNLPNPGAGNIPGALTFAGSGPGKCNCRTFSDTDYKEFAPRFGFAYQLTQRTVLRGGYGLFYIPGGNIGGNSTRGGPLGWSANPAVISPDGGVTPALFWDQGYPRNFISPPNFIPEFANGGGINWVIRDRGGLAPYYQNWNINIQRQFTNTLVISMAYAGSKGTRLPNGLFNPNQVDPRYLSLRGLLGANINSPEARAAIAAGTISGPKYSGFNGSVGQNLRQFPQYASVSVTGGSDVLGNSTYHAFQLEVKKRYSNGLQFLVAYTASKTIDDSGSILNGFFGSNGRDHFNRRIEKSVSVNDIPQNIAISYTYELPFGPKKKFLNTRGVAGKVAEGWQISGISLYRRGTPMELVVSNTLNLFNARNNPDRVPGVSPRSNVGLSGFDVFGGRDSYINLAAFREPAAFTFGNASRTLSDLRQPAFFNEDIGLAKRTKLKENVNFELRAEAFNIFNRTVFFVGSSLRGQAVNFSSPATVGRISGQLNPRRQIQFVFKINF